MSKSLSPGGRGQGEGEFFQLPLTVTIQGPLTYEEIARLFGVTAEAIRQREAKALEKIRVVVEKDPILKRELMDILSEPAPRQNFLKFLRQIAR